MWDGEFYEVTVEDVTATGAWVRIYDRRGYHSGRFAWHRPWLSYWSIRDTALRRVRKAMKLDAAKAANRAAIEAVQCDIDALAEVQQIIGTL